jgi:hypothetical protein
MPTVIGYHDVKDVDVWLASPLRAEAFATIGVTDIRTFVAPDDPTKIALILEVPDMDAFNAAMVGPEFATAMVNDGVIPPVTVLLER